MDSPLLVVRAKGYRDFIDDFATWLTWRRHCVNLALDSRSQFWIRFSLLCLLLSLGLLLLLFRIRSSNCPPLEVVDLSLHGYDLLIVFVWGTVVARLEVALVLVSSEIVGRQLSTFGDEILLLAHLVREMLVRNLFISFDEISSQLFRFLAELMEPCPDRAGAFIQFRNFISRELIPMLICKSLN
jgi:hypothetical protein